MKWEKVGYIGVDAGLCWVGDPCYCVTPDATEHPAKTWDEFCDKLNEEPSDEFGFLSNFSKDGVKSFNYKAGHNGLGMVVSTGYGDGTYPVFIKRNDEGRISEIRVKFI